MKNRDQVRASIIGASIAHQVWHQIHSGYGPPDPDLMRSFIEEAEAVAELFDEASPEVSDG